MYGLTVWSQIFVSSGKCKTIWKPYKNVVVENSFPYGFCRIFCMEYQISGVLGEFPLTRGTLLYKVRILPKSPQRKTEMFTTGIAYGSKKKLQRFLCGGQFWQNKNSKAGDEK